MLNNVKVVLVGTSHSGNIGSAARAMKVMGLTNLVLVDPQCKVDEQTLALAAGAADIAENAIIVKTLNEAVADCSLVVGSSARSRTLEWPTINSLLRCNKRPVSTYQSWQTSLSLVQRRFTAVKNWQKRKWIWCFTH